MTTKRPPAKEAQTSADAPNGPPTETHEIAVGPNETGHADQVKSVHVPNDEPEPTTEA